MVYYNQFLPYEVTPMTVRQRLARSNICMFLIPLFIAALLLLLGGGIALYILETTYLPRLGLSLQEMHMTLEQYEAAFSSFETFIWIYLGAAADDMLHECISHALSLPSYLRAAR